MPSSTLSQRAYDVVIWGATGFTGRLVCEYFAKNVMKSNNSIKWAIAGRNGKSLEELSAKLMKSHSSLKSPAIFTASTDNQISIDKIVKNTRVILSTAGPFQYCGTPVVDACVRLGTDYVDVTGEVPWVKKIIEKYHQIAEQNNVCVVPMCGFDSIPSDLGTLLTVQQIRSLFGQEAKNVRAYIVSSGGLSGGSLNTGIALSAEENQKIVCDAFALGGNSTGRPLVLPQEGDILDPYFDKFAGAWVGPNMFAPINTRVVRRSASLFAQKGVPYGAQFVYGPEVSVCKDEAEAKKLYRQLKFPPPAKKILEMMEKGVLFKPGEGPSTVDRAKAMFRFWLIGEAANGHRLLTTIKGADPGYTETAKMVSESALCVLRQQELLPRKGGVLTPASCCGLQLVDRLIPAGISFDVSILPAAQEHSFFKF